MIRKTCPTKENGGYAQGAAAAKLQTMVAPQDTPGPNRTFVPLDRRYQRERRSGLLPWDELKVHLGSSCV